MGGGGGCFSESKIKRDDSREIRNGVPPPRPPPPPPLEPKPLISSENRLSAVCISFYDFSSSLRLFSCAANKRGGGGGGGGPGGGGGGGKRSI